MLEFKNKSDAKVNDIYKPTTEATQARGHVYERYYKMREGKVHPWGGYIDDHIDFWNKQYESWRPPKGSSWQSTIVPPFTTTIIEKQLAEIIGQTIRPTAVERGDEDKIPAKITNEAMDYTWEIGDGDLESYDAIKQALICGKTVWQEYYYQDKRQVRALKKFNFETKEEEYEEKVVYDFDDVYGETVPLKEFFIDPAAQHINRGSRKAQDCIRRYLMSYDAFVENFKDSIWDQFKATAFVKAGTGLGDYYQYYQPVSGHEDLVEVLFYWGRRPDKLIIVANDIVIRDGPNPYAHKQLPFAEGSDVKRLVGNGFWDIGEPELLTSIQDEMTTIRRMRIDRQHLDIFKTFLTSDRDMLLEEDENLIAPNRFIQVSDPNNTKALESRDVNPSAYREEEMLKDDGRKVTGMETPASASTATEAAIFRDVTLKSLQLKITLLSKELFTDIARLRAANIAQFWSIPKTINIIDDKLITEYRKIRTSNYAIEIGKDGNVVKKESAGENFFVVTPDLITPKYGSFDFKFTAQPTLPIAKTLRQTKLNEMTQNPIFGLAVQNGYYDANKVSDAMVEANDFDPSDFRATDVASNPQAPAVDEQKLIEMAQSEFEQILKGAALPGTPYAPASHTEIHIMQMSSDAFKQAARQNPVITQNMVKHILEESEAQRIRGEGGEAGIPAIAPDIMGQYSSESQGIMSGTAKATTPNKILGPEMVPAAMSAK